MNQVLEPVGNHVQCGSVDCILIAAIGLEALNPENIVDFFLDVRQLGLCIDAADPPRQGIEGIQRTFPDLGLRWSQRSQRQ
jgi:hypothetical protein